MAMNEDYRYWVVLFYECLFKNFAFGECKRSMRERKRDQIDTCFITFLSDRRRKCHENCVIKFLSCCQPKENTGINTGANI